jgi:hypothetical protein
MNHRKRKLRRKARAPAYALETGFMIIESIRRIVVAVALATVPGLAQSTESLLQLNESFHQLAQNRLHPASEASAFLLG